MVAECQNVHNLEGDRMLRLKLVVLILFGSTLFCQTPTSGQSGDVLSRPIDSDLNSEEKTVGVNDLPPKPRLTATRKLKFKKKSGIVYQKTDTYELTCDLYIPEGDGPFPAILAIHGGAWRQGTKSILLRHAWKMAQAGYVVVAINYRHAPRYPFPAQVHDCKHAVRWMRTNAFNYKIDPNRIGGYGYSAGGHLVSMLGTTDEEDGLEGEVAKGMEGVDTRLSCVAAGGAPCEFSWIKDDSRILSYWLGGSPNEKPDTYTDASPTTYVTSDDPPFFLFHGDVDLVVPVDTSKKMHQLLQDRQVESQHFVVKNYGHVGAFSDLHWMDKAIEFFDAELK